MVHKFYKTSKWSSLRRAQLRKEPLCAYCLRQGSLTLATVADHIVPHRGNRELFFSGKLQSLCYTHHSSSKQSEERKGYGLEIGIDGVPIDPLHPANRMK